MFFTAVSRELHAGVQIVANIKDDERMAVLAVAKAAAAEKGKSIKSRQRFQESNHLRKKRALEKNVVDGLEAIGEFDPVVAMIDNATLDIVYEERGDMKKRQTFTRPNNWEIIATVSHVCITSVLLPKRTPPLELRN